MGYYTSYTLEVRGFKDKEELDRLKEVLKKDDIIGYALEEEYYLDPSEIGAEFGVYDTAKWYHHDDDMVEISRQFPDMTFKLCGIGEWVDDRWYTLYKNGQSETIEAVTVWPEPKHIKWGD